MPDTKIGMIGVGLMGHGIASSLQRNNWPVSFLDHAGNQPTDDLEAGGARKFTTAASLVGHCDVILLCVTGAPQVQQVLTGENGVFAGAIADKIIVDCSTSLPRTTREMAALAGRFNCRYLDAPMTRTPKEAAEGRLNLIVGGSQGDLDEVRPILDSFAETIVYSGELGSGHAMKLLHNYVSLGFSAVLAEAAAAARDAGVDPATFQDILANGGGGGVVLDRMTPYILDNDCGAFRFSLSNSNKDIGYYLTMAEQAGSSHRVADAIGLLFSAMVDRGHGENFVPELIELLGKK